MKKLIILLFSCCWLFNCEAQNSLDAVTISQLNENINRLPKYQGHLNDYEKIFSNDQTTELKNILNKIQENTGINVSFITLDSSYTTADLVGPFTNGVQSKWENEGVIKSNSVMIILSKSSKVFHISINGKKPIDKLSQQQLNEIGYKYFYPELKKHNYFTASLDGLNGLLQFLEQSKPSNG